MLNLIYWWFVVVLIGFCALPLTRRFFLSYPNRGYILTKIVGLCGVCFVNWMLCSLHILPFSRISIIASILIILLLSLYLGRNDLSNILTFFKSNQSFVIFSELIFLFGFLAFGIIRMCNPDIASTEKMPDFAFLNGILSSTYFPPKDPWFFGGTINYFYYGHYHIAMLTKLTGVPPEYGYNLGIALLFALTLTTATGVTFGLIRKLSYGFLGGLFVAFIGNLDGINQLLSKVLMGTEKFYPFNWFNWWMSSRVIVREGVDVTINEFPFWSYTLGDLHAHVNVVPFSLLVLGIILEFLRSSGLGKKTIGSGKDFTFRLLFAAIALGTIPASNTWDMPTYFTLMVAALIFGRQFIRQPQVGSFGGFVISPVTEIWQKIRKSEKVNLKKQELTWSEWASAIGCIVLVIALAVGLFFPYYHNFHPQGTQGLRVVDAIQRTLWDDFLTIYGFFFFCLITFIIVLLMPKISALNERLKPLIIASFGVIAFMLYLMFGTFMVTLCLLVLLFILIFPFCPDGEDSKEKFFAVSLFLFVLLILLGCEFFYIKDAYGKSLERQNTIFKFYYQAWIFCGISAAYAVYWLREKTKGAWLYGWEIVFRLLLVSTLAFPIFGTTVKCNNFAALTNGNSYAKFTLDGIWYMSWRFKGDFEAIHYLRDHANKDDVVLEASGPAFSHYGRISASTGLSTIIGWANHENIWRDGTWKTVNEKVQATREIYTTRDVQRAKELLEKYSIDWIFVGGLEREQYKDADFEKFKSMATKVIELKDSDNQMTYLYRFNK